MSIPPPYMTTADYLSDVMIFLKHHQWLYNYPNTHVLVEKVFDKIPDEWKTYLKNFSCDDLNKLPFGIVQSNCPDSLREFLDKIQSFVPVPTLNPACEIKMSSPGVSKKKQHEIVSLAPLIHEICEKNGICHVIDIGSGGGYLSHLLHKQYGYNVLGIEGNRKFVDLAYKNQEIYHKNSKDKVNFFHHYITDASLIQIEKIIEQYLKNENCCIVGLHACADLSITILDLFAKLNVVKSLVVMPCCYHRIELFSEGPGRECYKNYPASNLFKQMFEEFDSGTFIRRPFLRLACQSTIDSFTRLTKEEHESRACNMMFRAILEDVSEDENCRISRQKRKSGCDTFEQYLTNLKATHQILTNEGKALKSDSYDEFLNKMRKKWTEIKDVLWLAEVLVGLQTSIQSVCENLVLLDRVQALKEKGFCASVRKVTDERLSPRCFALVAVKNV